MRSPLKSEVHKQCGVSTVSCHRLTGHSSAREAQPTLIASVYRHQLARAMHGRVPTHLARTCMHTWTWCACTLQVSKTTTRSDTSASSRTPTSPHRRTWNACASALARAWRSRHKSHQRAPPLPQIDATRCTMDLPPYAWTAVVPPHVSTAVGLLVVYGADGGASARPALTASGPPPPPRLASPLARSRLAR